MRNRLLLYAVVCLVCFGIAGCGGSDNASGTAHVLNGPSPGSRYRTTGNVPRAPHSRSPKNWQISPDKVRMTIESIQFQGDSNSSTVTLSGCQVTYDRSK